MQRIKGRLGEWELATILKKAGHNVVNTRNDNFDRLIDDRYKAEIKRGDFIPRFFSDKLGYNHFLFTRRDSGKWLVTMYLDIFLKYFFRKVKPLND